MISVQMIPASLFCSFRILRSLIESICELLRNSSLHESDISLFFYTLLSKESIYFIHDLYTCIYILSTIYISTKPKYTIFIIPCILLEYMAQYVCPIGYLLLFFYSMYYFDNFYPEGDRIINLSEVSTSESLVLASTCERVSIALDYIPDDREVVIPVRIIEGMERVMDRGTVSEKQMLLI